MGKKPTLILGIESSCDETAAAILKDGKILANKVAGQAVHTAYGGVVPELASRAHQSHIVPVVSEALKEAGIEPGELDAIAYTRGPGLMGSLLVGSSFAKSLSLALGIPLIPVNHMHGHIASHFIENDLAFPFLCLTVSGGHTQIVRVDSFTEMQVLGETTDDAAGEAFDKAAKILGLPYPGGPEVDKLAESGNENAFSFSHPRVPGLDYSFSGLKTSFLYFVRKLSAHEVQERRHDICASYRKAIIDVLMEKLIRATEETGIKNVGIAGGVAANKGLRRRMEAERMARGWKVSIPAFQYCTDNAAMIAMAGYYLYREGKTGSQEEAAKARYEL